jgi:aspartate racemase
VKTIGILGGMTWHSSIEYYRLINTLANERLGGIHSARCVLFSVDMGAVDELMAEARWEEAGRLLAADARALERAGAEVFILGCNTLHNVWDTIVEELTIPSIHIGDATGAALVRDGHTRVGLLGTRYTMELAFLRGRLEEKSGIEVLIPDERDREALNRTVFEEFSRGSFTPATRAFYIDVIRGLAERGASAVVLGCTEIGLLLEPGDVDLPTYDTAHLHAAAAVEYASRPALTVESQPV